MHQKHAHCSFCGHRFPEQTPFPRTCDYCGNTTYVNPIPVAVVLLPVDDGLMLVRRAIAPHVGKLALPGGYIDLGETWQQAGAREVREETGLIIDPDALEMFWVRSAPDSTLLVFGLTSPHSAADLPVFVPTNESADRVVIRQPEALAFPLHTQAVQRFLGHLET